ncbi:MAG: CHAT domain-containing protein [Spirulina sp. SIO3F2]|nr:CHAT domain-containing protein [Spirulina sp. SIO3F2]
MSLTPLQQTLVSLLALTCLGVPSTALAQSITAAPDGTGTQVTIEGNTYQIHGGTQAGANLFHSFQDFGLTADEVGNFLSNPTVSNIFGRVVGGNPSIIDGLIQANPNLYLMNPAGIVFGANAQLNVGGDFLATTANQICFEHGCFNAAGVNHFNTLIGNPTTLGFLQTQSGGLVNAGTLAVQKGKSIHLSGGTVVNLGEVVAAGGNVAIAAIPGERRVRLNQAGHLLHLEVTDAVLTEGIELLAIPALLTAAPISMDKVIQPGAIALGGTLQGEQIDLYAAGQVTPNDTAVIQGDTRVIRFSESGENPDQAVFIDRRVDSPEELLYGAAAGTVSQTIEPDENGISVISEQLAEISDVVGNLESIAIVAEGNQGDFWLGSEWIRAENMANHVAQLQTWSEALTENADLLLYSCFTALGATGEMLVASIADLTGADVAASVNATSSHRYGGDWQLEHQTGAIEAESPFTTATLANWNGKLKTITIDSLTDDGTGTTLRDAFNLAKAGDLITFGTVGTVTLTNGVINWTTDDLTLAGNGATVSGNQVTRVFEIAANNAIVNNLTIRDGQSSGAAGINHVSGSLTLNNVTITNNSAQWGGGLATQGRLTLNNATVANNTASVHAGGMISSGSGTTLTLNHSNVTGNQAAGNGGGIRGYDSTVTVNHSVIANNSGTTAGGIWMDTGSVTLNHTTVTGNTAAEGGGILSNSGQITLNHATLSGNSVTDWGGAVFNRYGTVSVNQSSITGNTAGQTSGGIGSRTGNITLVNSIVSQNSAGRHHGGLGTGGNLTIANGQIADNTAGIDFDDLGANGHLSIQTTNPLDLDVDLQGTAAIQSGGSVTLTGNINTNGNDLTIAAGQDLTLNSTVSTFSNGDGGNLTLEAGGNINTRNLITASIGSGNGGNIALTSRDGEIQVGGGGLINTIAANGNAGNVLLKAPQKITAGLINTEAIAGQGGNVTLTSEGMVQLQGALDPADSGFNNFAASISSAGATGGGAIAIQHGGQGVIPFVIGDASRNGTAAAITAGNNATLLPEQSFFATINHNGIQISSNGLSADINSVIAGATPKNEFLDTAGLIERIGHQAGGRTLFHPEGYFTWDLPAEKALGGSLLDNEILQQFIKLDRFIAQSYSVFETATAEVAIEEQSGHAKDEDESQTETVANIHETFKQIEAQTGTTSALIYLVSNPEALELIVVTPDNHLRRQVIPEADRNRLRREIRTFRRRLTAQRQDYLKSAQQLYDWLIRPIESTVSNLNIDTLVFSLGEGLRALPLAALHDGDQFLIERYSLGQIPSLSLTDSRYQSLQQATVLAMGASRFAHLDPLPAVPNELAMVTAIQPGEQYLDTAFTWENLVAQSRQRNFEVVHLATHAAFQPGHALDSYIQLWGEEQITVERLRELRWYDDPTVELLVLSACQTALGDAHAELGFAGSAVQSGVKSVLASLWSVSDVGTMSLMSEFYQQLSDRAVTIKAEALRQAQLAMLRGETDLGQHPEIRAILPTALPLESGANFSHPYYWSAFTLVGSPW